ncbi:MAG: hypothetical protein AAF493_23560 [Pseudomonadota bacterium]
MILLQILQEQIDVLNEPGHALALAISVLMTAIICALYSWEPSKQ